MIYNSFDGLLYNFVLLLFCCKTITNTIEKCLSDFYQDICLRVKNSPSFWGCF